MKIKLIRYSDERKKAYCIKTLICDDNGKIRVFKKPIFQDGNEHIENLIHNRELLVKNYPNVDSCCIQPHEDGVEFEYIEGKSLLDIYYECIDCQNKKRFINVLLKHKDIMLGGEDNVCGFEESNSYKKIFGCGDIFKDKPAVKVCNFDAIASNIIIRDEKPVFIDYEWVYDFPIPQELALFHGIYELYCHNEKLNDIMTLNEALDVVGVESEVKKLSEIYESFRKFIICEDNGDCYALIKNICLKKMRNLGDVKEELNTLHESNFVMNAEIDRLQKVIAGHIEENNVMQAEIARLQGVIKNHIDENIVMQAETARLQGVIKNHIDENMVLQAETARLQGVIDGHIEENEKIKIKNTILSDENERLNAVLTEIYDSKIWKMTSVFRKDNK